MIKKDQFELMLTLIKKLAKKKKKKPGLSGGDDWYNVIYRERADIQK